LSSTARVGGTLTSTMDAMLAELQSHSAKSIEQFAVECPDWSQLMDSDRFDGAFFRLRNQLRQNEHQLAWILRQCFARSSTLESKLILLDVFHGAYQRDVVQRALVPEEQSIVEQLNEQFRLAAQLAERPLANGYVHWPPVARQLLYLHGLEQRIQRVFVHFSALCPRIIKSDVGWEMREAYRLANERIDRWDDVAPTNETRAHRSFRCV
jgi:hypothetical protein